MGRSSVRLMFFYKMKPKLPKLVPWMRPSYTKFISLKVPKVNGLLFLQRIKASRAHDDDEDEIEAELEAAVGYRLGQDHDADPSGPQTGTFRFPEEHYNMMQARLDSLTGTVDELCGASNTHFAHFDARLTELSSSSFNTMALSQQAFFDNMYCYFLLPPPLPPFE